MAAVENTFPPGVTGVVLAAGRGRRLGGPKALLVWSHDGCRVPLAQAHARAWSFCDRVLLVTRADIAATLRRQAPNMRAEVVVSTAPDAWGPAGSLMAAAAVMDPASHALLTPVDCPPVQRATVRALLDALARPGVLAARPQYGDRRGHPVALTPGIWLRYRHDPVPLRDILRELGDALADVPVSDGGVLADLDEPHQLDQEPQFF